MLLLPCCTPVVAAPRSTTPAQTTPAQTTPAQTEAAPIAAADDDPATPRWCIPSAPPPTPPGPSVAHYDCQRHATAVVRAVDARLRKLWTPARSPSRLEIHRTCDPLADTITRVVIESGYGHGFSLHLWQLERTDDRDWAVSRLDYRGDSADGVASVGRVGARVIDPLLAASRVALVSDAFEVTLPSEGLSLTAAMGSGDFHRVVRLEDDDGDVLERRFTGYPGNGLEEAPVVVASDALLEVLEAVPLAERPAEPVDRGFFVERYAAAAPHFDDEFFWWVTERYIVMARSFGQASLIPSLVERATKPGEHSVARARETAVAALAAVTGHDLRVGADGKPRALELAAADYAAACLPVR